MRTSFAFLVLGLSFGLLTISQSVYAQVAPEQQSVLAFEVYMERLATSDLAKESGASDASKMMPMGPNGQPTAVDMEDLRRMFGAVTAPPSLQSIMQMQEGVEQLDFNFFVRMQFRDAALADKGFEKMKEGAEPVTLGGKEYFRPPADEKAPNNVAFHKISADTVEIGTDEYLQLPTRKVFSPNLMAAWPKMPKAGFRVAVDLDGARKLIDEAVLMGGEQVPPQALTIVSNTSVLRLGVDFSGDSLVWLTATGKDSGSAQKINDTLTGLMTQAKGLAAMFLPSAPAEAQAPAKVIVDALATNVAGNDVNIVIPRPDGLGEAAGAIFGQMMMGGMGPGGPGGPGGGGDFGPGGDFGGGDDFGGFGDDPGFGDEQPAGFGDDAMDGFGE